MSTNRFQTAIAAFDAYHKKDPNVEIVDGRVVPKELVYAQRMTERLLSFSPDADEVVQLAARCQHIGRWEVVREKYPMDRKGYLQWRNEAKLHHARLAEAILKECGYDTATIDRLKTLILKKGLIGQHDVQILEDVACLVFLEHYANDFAEKHSEDKMIDILRKTMKKMSGTAKKSVAGMRFQPRLGALIEHASTPAS